MAIHAGMKEWSVLNVEIVTKDVPPGWHGPGTEKPFRSWKADLESWARIASYTDDESKISAVEFRVNVLVKDKIQSFPVFPGILAASVAYDRWVQGGAPPIGSAGSR